MSVLPSPFGFGLWTAHFTPTILGAPCVLLDRFTPEATLDAIDAFGVTVLAAVSTQFVMLLESRRARRPRPRRASACSTPAASGCRPTAPPRSRTAPARGCCSSTARTRPVRSRPRRSTDDRRVRLETAGRVIPELHVRLFDPDTGADVTATGGPGIAACRGAVNCLGYWDDDAANAELFTPDGWMRTGDLCTIAPDGVLTVVGRTSDVVIRGGKNISAAQVEAEVSTHPAVALCAAVAMPDPVFGERVCVYLEVRTGATAPDLDALRAHLDARGVGKELWPEHVVVVDALPRASGGKIAKAELRADAARPPPDPPTRSDSHSRSTVGARVRAVVTTSGRGGRRGRRRRRSARSRWPCPPRAWPRRPPGSRRGRHRRRAGASAARGP